MRRYIVLLLLVAAAAGLVFVSQVYLGDAVFVQYQEWQASPSAAVVLATLAMAACALLLLFKVLSWIVFLPYHFSRWRRDQRREKQAQLLSSALRSLMLEKNGDSVKTFSGLAHGDSAEAGVCAWYAAAAAEKLGDESGRRKFLRRTAACRDDAVSAPAKATLAKLSGHLTEAAGILKNAGAMDGPPLLTAMLHDIWRRKNEWREALATAYRLSDLQSSAAHRMFVREAVARQLTDADDIGMLKLFWKNEVRAEEKKDQSLLADYIYALHRLGDEKQSLGELSRAVKSGKVSADILRATAVLGDKKMCESAFTGNESRADGEDGERFLPALAELAARLELWGKARRYYQRANAAAPRRQYERALAELEEKIKTAAAQPG